MKVFHGSNNVKDYFPGYMQRVYKAVSRCDKGQKILGIPAGNGILSNRLRQDGHTVVQADINRKRPEYAHADMKSRLPFSDGAFDAVYASKDSITL